MPHAAQAVTLPWLLIAAIALLAPVVVVGTWLASKYLLLDAPPGGLGRVGVAHGLGGLAGLAVLAAALWRQAPAAQAIRRGAGGFGWFSGALIAAALLAGATILVTHLRRRPVPIGLVAAHGLLAITGYTLLVTYLTMIH